ncbi:MAG: bifunctional 4-hydroxy-3-methylbut-2-enyl diphosphate reductase/30S ribosomal protein [Clostridia bacterium]|jgi:4-hydroxy-3-methylbut-2-enyl diphosphate reductase|nr:bifunctional 4-hydroxy-3-methylbut-2-enyl diphosphate reductase/30S ribosomal protein [Clostridia bacterium]
MRRGANLEEMLNKEVSFRIIEIEDGKRRKIIGSVKAVLQEEHDKSAKAVWETIDVGVKYSGTVKSLTSFGAFVDIGGVDGLVHISDMSWRKIGHPSEVVNVGDVIEVEVKNLNLETKKISLTMKRSDENPWEILKNKYHVGDIIDVKVLKLMSYGAFVSVIPGIDGLIHISQLANIHVDKVSSVLTVGQEVAAKITEINYETKKISLSIKAIATGKLPEENESSISENPDNITKE